MKTTGEKAKAAGPPRKQKHMNLRAIDNVPSTELDADDTGFGAPPPRARGVAAVNIDEARPPAFADDALALRFAEAHADKLRHVAMWGKWLIWSGQKWLQDDTKQAVDL